MKVRLLGLVALSCAVGLIVSFSSGYPSQSKNSPDKDLSKDEQDLFNEINQARANPQAYASYLEKLKPFFNGKEYRTATLEVTTEEGWSAVAEAISFLRAAKPLGPLSRSSGLCQAAIAHVKDQSQSGTTGHKSGATGTMVEDRVKPFGSWQGGIGENLSYGSESARERVLTWLIDDGFPSRGHRRRIMSSDYNVAGVCCGPHPQYGTMCVLTLAGNFIDASAAKAPTGNQNNAKSTLKNSPPSANISVTPQTQSNSAATNTNTAKTSTSGGAANGNKNANKNTNTNANKTKRP